MNKTMIAAALAASVVAGTAQAATFDFAGTFTMRDSTGGVVGGDPLVLGTMQLDMGTGAGTANIGPSVPFFGQDWTAHDVQFQMTGPATASGSMLFDWGPTTNIFVTIDFAVTMNGDGSIDFVTVDGDGDGIIGNAMDNGPFFGFSAAFAGTATPQIPVPAAVWLFGSGLVGLVAAARRKAA